MDEETVATDVDGVQARVTRFGKLPARIQPEEIVETVETSSRQSWPDPAGTEEQRQALLGGG
jgi:hypothetical protein